MHSRLIRRKFLDYFAQRGHKEVASSSLVPADDPTLLFTNAGMVQFKRTFLGQEHRDYTRATTCQKCVRAGGKHNDLEQVGHTKRHHTFFEMLGNFSFGDYFKRDAIAFAWEFVTGKDYLGLPPDRLRVTVHHTDEEARGFWRELAGLPDHRVYGLGDKDNFWQMGDTGPCGPCSEIYVDLEWRPGEVPAEIPQAEFETLAEAGRFLEIWNLVFMQFDRSADGTLTPLPKPSVDTGAGLERIAAVMQGEDDNFHTDLFQPLIDRVGELVGRPYDRASVDRASYRVLADHARAVAFLLADGVFPSNEGRGYVLRRILRRAVRHAWLLGRKEPTLVDVVETVIESMQDIYPELKSRSKHVLDTTRVEEQGFLTTIEGGLSRFDQIAPVLTADGATDIRGTVSGEDAFRPYDTFGVPIALTELMARERGYTVDIAGFETALQNQRRRSQEERKSKKLTVETDTLADWSQWELPTGERSAEGAFVGYDTVEIETQATAVRHLPDDRVAVLLRESPFYAESGGQISDHGEIAGDGWRVEVDDVRKIDGRPAAVGPLTGTFRFGRVTARVPSERRRETERNHTATHLLHAALRQVLGEAVHQAGSLVAPERLRFDFTHHGPVKRERLDEIEAIVNQEIWRAIPVTTDEMAYQDARNAGAMALFGEKYGDVVRVVKIPGFSMELCGGTHVRNTAQIGFFKIVSETGVAAGVRRIEAVTGPGAYDFVRGEERQLHRVADALRVPADQLERRVTQLLEERRVLERRIEEAMRGGGDQLESLLDKSVSVGRNGVRYVSGTVRASDVRELQVFGDALRERIGSGVGVVGSKFSDGKGGLIVIVSDDLREKGIRADSLIKEIAAAAGGRGGGKAHMAQAGLPDAERFEEAAQRGLELVGAALSGA